MIDIYRLCIRAGEEAVAIAAKFLSFPKAKPCTGSGCRKEIPDLLKQLGVKNVLVVTGHTIGKTVAPEIIESVRNSGINAEHFSGVEANPTTDVVCKIRDMYLEKHCDGFLAIGGGSAIDAAKGAAALVTKKGKTCQQLAGLVKVMKEIPPFIAVPTTSGTGSETTMAAVITDSKTHHKYPIMDPVLIPKYAVMDPELTVNLPKGTTATTGMDALTHAVESYLCVTNYTKESVKFAEEATELIFKYLERAYNTPDDIEARQKMMEAAYKAGWSFGRAGVGNVHAIAHTLGGLYNTPHGLANAVILPIVLEDYGKAVHKKLARLSEIAGIKSTGSDEEKAKAFINAIYEMNRKMEIPAGLKVEEKDIPQMIKWAKSEANPVYPVPVIYNDDDFSRVINVLKSRA